MNMRAVHFWNTIPSHKRDADTFQNSKNMLTDNQVCDHDMGNVPVAHVFYLCICWMLKCIVLSEPYYACAAAEWTEWEMVCELI